MKNKLSFQVGIETSTRCGGNCEGCALDAQERYEVKSFDVLFFEKQLQHGIDWIYQKLEKEGVEVPEAITTFFGQGDHFLMEDEDILALESIVHKLWPTKWRPQTVFFLTASAVTNQTLLKRRAQILRENGLAHKCNWFIQVVFDPKKFKATKDFGAIYLENILFLKQTYKMVELTVNLAEDITNHMSALEFHEWVKIHKIKHVEFNLVVRKDLYEMWKSGLPKVWFWLKELIALAWRDGAYEVNFMPWTTRRLIKIQESQELLQSVDIGERVVYITGENKEIPSQVGPIGNVAPFYERNFNGKMFDEEKLAIATSRYFSTKKPCFNCKFNKLCEDGGVYPWTQTMPNIYNSGCPWGLDSWYEHLLELIKQNKGYKGQTIFDKNPIPSDDLRVDSTQATNLYFEGKDVRNFDK